MARNDLPQNKLWDEKYTAKSDFFGNEPSETAVRTVEEMKKRGFRKVLELGCGQGRDTFYFIDNGMDVVALDYSETGICQMAEIAEERKLGTRLGLKVHDIRFFLPLPNDSVDVVFSNLFFTMQLKEEEIRKILEECLRVLKPGGLNVYSVRSINDPDYKRGKHYGEDMYQNPQGMIVHFFDEKKIKRLATGYNVLWIRELEERSPPFVKILYEAGLQKPVDKQ